MHPAPAPAWPGLQGSAEQLAGLLSIFSYRFSPTITMRARSKSNTLQARGDWDFASLLAGQAGRVGLQAGASLSCSAAPRQGWEDLLLLVFCLWFFGLLSQIVKHVAPFLRCRKWRLRSEGFFFFKLRQGLAVIVVQDGLLTV